MILNFFWREVILSLLEISRVILYCQKIVKPSLKTCFQCKVLQKLLCNEASLYVLKVKDTYWVCPEQVDQWEQEVWTRKINSELEELKGIQMQIMHDLKKYIQKLLQGQNNMQQLINSLVESNKKKDNEIKILTNRVDELKQYTRRDNVIVSGLAVKPRTFASVASSHPAENAENLPHHEQDSIETESFVNRKTKQRLLSNA